MKYHSKRKVYGAKHVFINVMYNLGVSVNNIVAFTGVSRATVYSHIKR